MNPPKIYRTKENNNYARIENPKKSKLIVGVPNNIIEIVISEHHKHQVNDEFHSKQLMSITQHRNIQNRNKLFKHESNNYNNYDAIYNI